MDIEAIQQPIAVDLGAEEDSGAEVDWPHKLKEHCRCTSGYCEWLRARHNTGKLPLPADIEASHAEKIECVPRANARGISKATALLINAAESRSMVEWKHGMTLEEAETEFRMLTLRIDQDLKVHCQQGKWVTRAGTDGYPGFRSLLHLKALGH